MVSILFAVLVTAALVLLGSVTAEGAPPAPIATRPAPPRRPRYTIKVNANDATSMAPDEIKRLHPIAPGSGPLSDSPAAVDASGTPMVYTLSNPPPPARAPFEASNPPVSSPYLTDGELYGDWVALRAACVTVSAGEGSNARWRLCPFANLTRYDAETEEVTVLGVWREWTVGDDGHLAMTFDDGCPCDSNAAAAAAADSSGTKRHSVRVLVSCRVEDVFSHPEKEGLVADDDWSYDEALIATTSFTRPEPKAPAEGERRPDRCSLTATLALSSLSYLCGGPRRPALPGAEGSGAPAAVAQLKEGRDPTAAAAAAAIAAATAAAAAPADGGVDGDDLLFSDLPGDPTGSPTSPPPVPLPASIAPPGYEPVPSSAAVCRSQHAFLAAEAAALAACIEEWASAAAAWARISIPSHDPRNSEDLRREMEQYEKRIRSDPNGSTLGSPMGQVLSQLVRVPIKCVKYVSRETSPETLFFTPEQLKEGQDMLAAAGI